MYKKIGKDITLTELQKIMTLSLLELDCGVPENFQFPVRMP